jgi:hypothetical protein
VTSNGSLLPELPKLFDLLGADSWTVYGLLTQHHPELDGDTPLSALQRGKVNQVLAAAENINTPDHGSPVASPRGLLGYGCE